MSKKKETDLSKDKQILLAVERTRLANERTFLSWIRTSIACIGGGVAMARLIIFNTETHKSVAKYSGDFLIVIGILFLIFSLINFRSLKKQIPHVPEFKETTSYFITFAAIALIVLAVVLLTIM